VKKNVLEKLSNHQISRDKAYQALKKEKRIKKPKARFLKLNIHLKDQVMLNMVLNTLFFLPLPVFLVKIGKRFTPEEMRFAYELMDYAKGTQIDIDTEEARIYIKLF
jgi:hypothetical protein